MNDRLTRPIGKNSVHLCVDMQRLFAPGGPWATPSIDPIIPVVIRITEQCPARTIFTRFIPPRDPENMPGMWQRFFVKWQGLTRRYIDSQMLELLHPLSRFAPPAAIFDKSVYSAFGNVRLLAYLRHRAVSTLIITGAETDVCVLATVLAAVDYGYRVILVSDGLCSSSTETHDALLSVYRSRFSEQIETAPSEEVIDAWSIDH
ncbi:cysteine hydrolase family protein [Microvirga sp. 2MCAF38]|uniref:cysteine hydrolase family protein n=1 Tax=Microvirga sp. 2MCAF38 TaxID=3232989 RepID=UPI003F97763F